MTASIAECEIRTGSSNLSETGSSLNDSESEDESFIELDADSILSYLDDDNLLIDVDNGESYLGCYPNRPKSVFWSELPGTRRYTPNSFFII